MKHGEPQSEVPIDVWLGDDPDLAMVNADMAAWMEAHPCNCHALCVCDNSEGPLHAEGEERQ